MIPLDTILDKCAQWHELSIDAQTVHSCHVRNRIGLRIYIWNVWGQRSKHTPVCTDFDAGVWRYSRASKCDVRCLGYLHKHHTPFTAHFLFHHFMHKAFDHSTSNSTIRQAMWFCGKRYQILSLPKNLNLGNIILLSKGFSDCIQKTSRVYCSKHWDQTGSFQSQHSDLAQRTWVVTAGWGLKLPSWHFISLSKSLKNVTAYLGAKRVTVKSKKVYY